MATPCVWFCSVHWGGVTPGCWPPTITCVVQGAQTVGGQGAAGRQLGHTTVGQSLTAGADQTGAGGSDWRFTNWSAGPNGLVGSTGTRGSTGTNPPGLTGAAMSSRRATRWSTWTGKNTLPLAAGIAATGKSEEESMTGGVAG
jgi:hypothetical protein